MTSPSKTESSMIFIDRNLAAKEDLCVFNDRSCDQRTSMGVFDIEALWLRAFYFDLVTYYFEVLPLSIKHVLVSVST